MRKAAAQLEGQGDLLEKEKNDEQALVSKEPDIDVSVEGETPVVDKAKEPQVDDVADLKKQLEALKKSEQVNLETQERLKREAAEAIAQRQKIETEVVEQRSNTAQAQLDAIEAAIASTKAEATAAERDLESAIQMADSKAQADAYRRLSRSESNLGRLEDGKIELEQGIAAAKEAAKVEPKTQKNEQQDAVEAMNVPERAKEWLRDHREFVDNPRKNLKLQSAHFDALDEGHKEFSTDYFLAVEKLLGLRKAEKEEKDDVDDKSDDDRAAIGSAPINRDSGGSGNGDGNTRTRVRLTKDQAEAARISGVSEKVNAENLLKLNEAKKNGLYQEGRG